MLGCRFIQVFDSYDSFCFSLPFGIEIFKQGKDDSIAALGVLEVSHNLQPASDLSETTLDNVCSPDHFAYLPGKLKDGDEPVEIILRTFHRPGNLFPPFSFPDPELFGRQAG
jgi:hypothetical protein